MMTDADKRLKNCLQGKLETFRKDQPYVWKLGLTENDFADLHQQLEASIASHAGDKQHLLTADYALLSMVYLAEWYKRNYSPVTNEKSLLDWSSKELKQLWEASGLNIDTFVYQSLDGKRMWQYSIYILGGLAIHHELGRTDNRFLKQICRLYYGEAGEIEQLAGDSSRAIAFKESIAQGHSLYQFVKAILTEEKAFADEDTTHPHSDVSRFIQRIKTANEEVLKEKFRLEWVFLYARNYSYLTRRLRLLLRPEDAGGTHHPYLRLERLHNWGFTQLEQVFRIRVSIRFLQDDKIVQEADFNRPLLTFINTGEAESGFVAWSTSRIATFSAVPAEPFNQVQVIMKTDRGQEAIVHQEDVPDIMQFYRISMEEELWTSLPHRQKQTAVWYSDQWKPETPNVDTDRKVIHTAQGDSHPWNWTFIANEIKLTHSNGEYRTFYNRAGYAQIQAQLHTDTIHYLEGGLVKYVRSYEDDLEVEELPLIYGKEDWMVSNQAAMEEDWICTEKPCIERIEYKGGNNRYQEWTAENSPAYGLVALRIYLQGEPKLLRAVYTPEIKRCFDTHSIRYGSTTIEDECTPQDLPHKPTTTIRIGHSDEYVEVEVYRPTLLKVICMDGKAIRTVDNQPVCVPYSLKNRLTVHDFSVDGYTSYSCRNLPNIYNQLNLQVADAALQAWKEGRAYRVKEIDAYAPESLWMSWGDSSESTASGDWYTWDYYEDTEPQPCPADTEPAPCCIVFQSLRDYDGQQPCLPPQRGKFMPFKYKKNRISVVKVFKVAAQHRTYFFPFQPLQKVTDFVEELYQPLLAEMGGKLNQNTISDLQRLAEEFGFSWEDKNINLEF